MTEQRFLTMARYLSLAIMIALLPGCAETQLASHYVKKVWKDQNPSVGAYKVGNPYKVAGKTYYPEERFSYTETGIASWYGPGFHGKKTANGETYDQYELTAAHKTLQMPSLVRVTNLENGRSIVVRINDRGPFKSSRIIDLSERGAELLGFKNQGTAKVRLDVLEHESRQIAAAAKMGKDTSRFDVASLNRPGGRFSPPQVQNPAFQPVTLKKPAPMILLDDAEAIPLPESLRPEVARQGDMIISTQPLDLSVEKIEVAALDDLTPRRLQDRTVARPADEIDFLKKIDFSDTSGIDGHASQGRFVPDPVVTQTAVGPSEIYVQAGAFGNYHNAEKLAASLAHIGVVNITEADVADNRFYRVRIGPIAQVRDADSVLAQVMDAGQKNARIIID